MKNSNQSPEGFIVVIKPKSSRMKTIPIPVLKYIRVSLEKEKKSGKILTWVTNSGFDTITSL